MPPFENPACYGRRLYLADGREVLFNDCSDVASDILAEIFEPPTGNEMYRNWVLNGGTFKGEPDMYYDVTKMQYVKPGDVCDFGAKKGENDMGYSYRESVNIGNGSKVYITEHGVERFGDLPTDVRILCDAIDQLIAQNKVNSYIVKQALVNFSEIDKVIFNIPATIVFWKNGDKTVVKCQDGERFDPEKGLAMAFMKHVLGHKGHYMETVKKHTAQYIELQKLVDDAMGDTRDTAPGVKLTEKAEVK